MIANFKNTNPGVESCDFINMLSNYNLWTDLFVTGSDFYFSSESAITNKLQWANNIILGNITPLYHIKEIEPNNEDPVRYTGVQDIEVEIYKGKYKYTFYFNYDLALYAKISKLHNKPAYVYMFDKNDNIYGNLNGTDIYGIRCELFAVGKPILGEGQAPSGFKVSIVIDGGDGDSIRVYEKDFTALDLVYYEVENYTISNITRNTPLEIDLTLLDSGGDPATGFLQADFSFTDNLNGGLTIDTFSEGAPGVYTITFTEVVTTGTAYFSGGASVASYLYDFGTHTVVLIDSFSSFYDTVNNTFDQRIPTGWVFSSADPASACLADYNMNESSGDLLLSIIGGSGAQSWMLQLSSSFSYFTYNAQYLVEIEYMTNTAETIRLATSFVSAGGSSAYNSVLDDTGGVFGKFFVEMESPVLPALPYFKFGKLNENPAVTYDLTIRQIKFYKIT